MLHLWSPAGCRDSTACQLQVPTLPSTNVPGGTDPDYMSNSGLGPENYQNCPSSENLPNASRESTPPHNQPEYIRKPRAYDRPGKKPAAPYECDPLELQKHCKRRGGSEFAVNWVTVTFKRVVSLDALVRTLDFAEVENADRGISNRFKLHQAYDGFLAKIGHHFECGLCEKGKRTHWVHKKDAVRHLRKFHFGLADRCSTW